MELFDDFTWRSPEGQGELSMSEQEKKDLETVKYCGKFLRLVKNQTPESCMAAVQLLPSNLQYVKKQTEEICMEAVKRDTSAINLIRSEELQKQVQSKLDLPDEVYSLSLQDGDYDKEIRKLYKKLMKIFKVPKTNPLPKAAVYILNSLVDQELELSALFNQIPEYCVMAMAIEPGEFCYVKRQTPELCKVAVALWYENLQRVREQTFDICLIAAQYNAEALQYIRDPEIKKQVEESLSTWKWKKANGAVPSDVVAHGKVIKEPQASTMSLF